MSMYIPLARKTKNIEQNSTSKSAKCRAAQWCCGDIEIGRSTVFVVIDTDTEQVLMCQASKLPRRKTERKTELDLHVLENCFKFYGPPARLLVVPNDPILTDSFKSLCNQSGVQYLVDPSVYLDNVETDPESMPEMAHNQLTRCAWEIHDTYGPLMLVEGHLNITFWIDLTKSPLFYFFLYRCIALMNAGLSMPKERAEADWQSASQEWFRVKKTLKKKVAQRTKILKKLAGGKTDLFQELSEQYTFKCVAHVFRQADSHFWPPMPQTFLVTFPGGRLELE